MISWSATHQQGQSYNTSTNKPVIPKWGKQAVLNYIADYGRLRSANPYAGSDLGLDQNTLSMMPGGTRDLAAGAKLGAEENINDTYAAPGGPGMGSFAHKAALAGLEGEYATSVADSARQAALADAELRRRDFAARLSTGQAIGGLARSFATTRNRQKQRYVSHAASIGQ